MANERIEINTFEGQQKKIKRVVAGDNINLNFDDKENLIISAQGGSGGTDIEVMQIVPDTNLQVLYADGLATFSGMIANLKNGDNPMSVPAEIELPIKAGDNVVIDASEDDKYLIVKTENAGGGGVHTITADENTIASQLITLDEQGKTVLYIDANLTFQIETLDTQLLSFPKSEDGTVTPTYQQSSIGIAGYYPHGILLGNNIIQFIDSENGKQFILMTNTNDANPIECTVFFKQYTANENDFMFEANNGVNTSMSTSIFTIYYLDSAN